MGLDVLDLVVVPWPSETQGHRALSDRGERQRDGALFLKTWKVLQRLVDAGSVHAIGRICLGFYRPTFYFQGKRRGRNEHRFVC